MKRALLWVTAVLAVLTLTSCPEPFDLTGQLKGKTLVYTMNAGDQIMVHTATFDASGTAGTFELTVSEYGYPTQAAEDSGDYTQQTWFRTGGERGTFTYDNDSYLLTATKTDVWALKDDATTAFQADYEYRTLASTFGPDCTAASSVMSYEVVFNQDYAPSVYVASGGSYVQHFNTRSSETIAGVTTEVVQNETETWTLGATTASKVFERVTVSSVTGSDPVTETYRQTYDFNVSNLFAIGSTAANETFQSIWKDGKSVSFGLGRTRYTMVNYEGSTAPPAPTVDPSTGIGGSIGPMPAYYINENPQESELYSFTKQKEYIHETAYLSAAMRRAE